MDKYCLADAHPYLNYVSGAHWLLGIQCTGTVDFHRKELFIVMGLQMDRCFSYVGCLEGKARKTAVQSKGEFSHLNTKLIHKMSYSHLEFTDGMKLIILPRFHPCAITVRTKCSPSEQQIKMHAQVNPSWKK